MFELFNKFKPKFMSNEEIKNDVASDENTRGATDPEGSAPATPEDQAPGIKVPAGHQVPGTNVSTGVSEEVSEDSPQESTDASEQPDPA